MTAAVALDAYGDPAVIDCSQHGELRAEWLLDGGIRTAYLCAPQDEQQRLRSLFVTLIASVLSEVYERATRSGRFPKVGHARTVSATHPGTSPPTRPSARTRHSAATRPRPRPATPSYS